RAQAANQGRDAALQLAGGPLGGLLLGVGGWLVGVAMTVCHVVAAVTAGMLRGTRSRVAKPENGDEDAAAKRVADGPAVDARDGLGFPSELSADAAAVAAPASAPAKTSAWAELREGFSWLLSRP
ncbi:MFS transporter, partial [Pseudomonas sp. BGM005]|nr:MFS transporter [Pseudomonas sp. BG5]